jgi:phosphatidylglycerol---prolipoprotein diacylglyceryl transferase
MTIWNTLPFHISPYLIEFQSFGIRYYSLMYIFAFATFYFLLKYRIKKEDISLKPDLPDDFLIWAITGILLGARLGYVLFYDLSYYIHYPLSIVLPFSFSGGFHFTGISGMSYHGGLIGVTLATLLYCRKNNINISYFTDIISPIAPLGYTFGRLGNFLNAELYGRPTDMPWGMIFPTDPDRLLRHPSQLYEAFFEGIVLFIILWTIRKQEWTKNKLFGLYLIGYGIIRFIIEFFREPDEQLNFVISVLSMGLTMGQVLCFIMILSGLVIIFTVNYFMAK